MDRYYRTLNLAPGASLVEIKKAFRKSVRKHHPDMNGVEQASHGEKEPFSITGPGEYEVKKIFIRGYPSRSTYGGSDGINTIYTIRMEGMNLCFLGALSEKKLPAAVTEALDQVDILFVPIGGDGVLAALPAHELSVELEA